MLRYLSLYTALLLGANAALAAPVDWSAYTEGGLNKLTTASAPVPDVAFADPDGNELTLKDYAGKVVLLNFWATWCAPCREEMPALEALQQQLGGDDFQVVTVAAGRNPPAAMQKFFDEIGVKALPMNTDARQRLSAAMGVMAMPVTVLIDRDGQEIARLIGGAEWDHPQAVALIEQVMAD